MTHKLRSDRHSAFATWFGYSRAPTQQQRRFESSSHSAPAPGLFWQTRSGSYFEGDINMHKWKLAIAVLAIALFAAWYAFRPERLVLNHRVNEGFPAGEDPSSAQVLESGTFYAVVHPTAGTATIYRLGNGDRILRFTNFNTSNGPNVHVYLVAADDAKDSATVKSAASIDLGTIKGNIGDQNYALGTDLDLSKYRTVSIWCKRFAVNFGAAPLRVDHAMLQN
jgi:hypothetical protein